MKRSLRTILVLLTVILALALVVSCTTTSKTSYKSFAGSIMEISKYGNIKTDIPSEALFAAGYELGDEVTVVFDNGKSVSVPFVSTYSDVDKGAPLARVDEDCIAMAINYGNFAGNNELAVGNNLILSLEEKAAYKTEFEIRHLERTDNRADYASDAVFGNFRGVSVGNIAPEMLYRSCHPSNGEVRAPYVNALVEQAGIKTVINLADSKEALTDKIDMDSYYGKLFQDGQIITLDMGVDFKDPSFYEKLHDGLIFMINHKGPYLVHCNEGKDRAGMVSALLESLMGATHQEIIGDYMVTYENYYHIEKNEVKYPIIGRIITSILTDINNGQAVDNNTDLVKMAKTYLVNVIGLTNTEVADLQARLSGN